MAGTRRWTRTPAALVAAAAAAALIVAACGGGDSTGSSGGGNGTLSGTAVKGPVNGGTMTAFAVRNGTKGEQLGTATTDAQGRFTISIGSYAGPVLMEMSGGAYVDEATSATMSMAPGDVMRAVVPSVAAGSATSGIVVTPLTSMAQARCQAMSGAMTDANIAAANGAVSSYFMVDDVLHTLPINPTAQGSGAGATQDAKNYGMAVAGMSQYAHTLGMSSSSGIVTAMMDDASDGVMNGMMGTTPISMAGKGGMMNAGMMQASAGTSTLADAMAQFIGSPMNKSGVTMSDMQPLVDHLHGSNGQLPGASAATGARTSSGKVFLGAVHGGSMTAFAVVNGGKGAQLGTAPVDAQGGFTISLGDYSGPVMMEMSGGSYTDEATGAPMEMGAADVMTAVVTSDAAASGATGIVVTPLTSMAQTRAQGMPGGMTDANVAAANGAVGRYFMVNDILHTMPVDPAAGGSAPGATQDSKNYGMTVAAMSQYAKDIGMSTSSGIVTAMMDDASDGVMNGMMGATSISMRGMGGMMGGSMMQPSAGTASLATAMSKFVDSAMNKSGVSRSDVQPLMDRLNGSSGAIE